MLSDRGGREVVDEICSRILQMNLEEIFGVRLLHRHNIISFNESMVESNEYIDGIGSCLVTKPREADLIKFPNHWSIADSAAIPLEYSVDHLVSITDIPASVFKDLVLEAGRILTSSQLQSILGICVIRRDYFSTRPDDRAILIETSDVTSRANIVRFEDGKNFDPKSLITTTWTARREDDGTGCNTSCIAGSCVPFSACVRDDEGNHSEQTTHSRGDHNQVHYETGE